MKEFIEYIVKNLVDQPEKVAVHCYEKDQGIMVELRVSEGDVGKVIGMKGLTIKSLRTIVITACARLGYRVRLDLIK